MKIQNENWLTPVELEREFGISTNQQAKMRMRKNYEDGKKGIPFCKVGKRILYPADEIELWMREQIIK